MCDRIEGKCLCPLGDACAMPVRSHIKRFREEFEAHVRERPLPAARDVAHVDPRPEAAARCCRW